MKCPIDGENLVMAERQGIEIDYCPKCRGVWLDRGELDKIIDRAVPAAAPAPAAAPTAPPPSGGLFGAAPPPRDEGRYSESRPRERYDDDDDDYRKRGFDPRHGHDPRYAKRKRGGFLGELFDFD